MCGVRRIRVSQVEKRLTAHLSHKDGTPLVAKKGEKKEKKEKYDQPFMMLSLSLF